MQWHYEKGGSQAGPVSDSELSALLHAGQITRSTLVWRQGMNNWEPLSSAAPHLMETQSPPPATGPVNPYATPAAQPQEDLAADGKVDVGRDFGRGFSLFFQKFAPLAGGALLFGLVTAFAGMIPCMNAIIGLVFTIPLQAGFYFFCLSHLRDERPGIGTIFSGFQRNFAQLVLLNLVMIAIGVAAMILIAIVFFVFNIDIFSGAFPDPEDYFRQFRADWTQALIRLVIPGLVAIVIGLYLHLILTFAPVLIVDRLAGLGEGLRRSVHAVHRNLPKLFVLMIICWAIIIFVTLVVLVPFVIAAIPLFESSAGSGGLLLQLIQVGAQFILALFQPLIMLVWILPMLYAYTEIFGVTGPREKI